MSKKHLLKSAALVSLPIALFSLSALILNSKGVMSIFENIKASAGNNTQYDPQSAYQMALIAGPIGMMIFSFIFMFLIGLLRNKLASSPVFVWYTICLVAGLFMAMLISLPISKLIIATITSTSWLFFGYLTRKTT